MRKKPPEVVARRQAMIGNILCIQVEPGTKVFDGDAKYAGTVWNKRPVKLGTHAIYLSTDDFLAAEAALPKPKRIIH
jgi:hypothetical protein